MSKLQCIIGYKPEASNKIDTQIFIYNLKPSYITTSLLYILLRTLMVYLLEKVAKLILFCEIYTYKARKDKSAGYLVQELFFASFFYCAFDFKRENKETNHAVSSYLLFLK